MADRIGCMDCRELAPETAEFDTSITTKFGWRLARRILEDGTRAMEWRCPACWRVYKARAGRAALPLRSR